LVKFADRIAYINHDIDDACRAGILQITDIPEKLRRTLGEGHSARINTMVNSLIRCSEGQNDISMEPEILDATMQLRAFLYENVYLNPAAKSQEVKARALLIRLFEHYVKNPDKLPTLYKNNIEQDGVQRCVCDFLSGMTDRYAIETYNELYIPRVWRGPVQGG
jgi:dGTPase